jgi:hypothetical protein
MNMNRAYSHQAVEWVSEDGRRECRICPRPLIGIGPTLRHHDEAVRHRQPDPAMADAVADAVIIAARALETMLTEARANDLDRARAVIDALEEAGALAPRRRWRSRARLAAA